MALKARILFVCSQNATHGWMAEGFTRYYGGSEVYVESAGLEPEPLNPYCQWAMNETGIDISQQEIDPLRCKDLASFSHIVTLSSGEKQFPQAPEGVELETWDLPDPERVFGNPEETIAAFRFVRNEIERRVKRLLTSIFE